jgi:hypothetical protein
MAEQLFLFVQMEFPWELGPSDGRYLLRSEAGGEPERVVVLDTLGAQRRPGRLTSRRRQTASPHPENVATARATVIDPVPVSAELQASKWLSQLDSEREIKATVAVLNRVLYFHRIASADPYLHELSVAQALVIRAGWGEGEQVADGNWREAIELPRGEQKTRRRASALRPQERLAVLLGARGSALVCEELTLRARLDFDHGRTAHAAVGLNSAYVLALSELAAENRTDLALRLAELRELHERVKKSAEKALVDELAEPEQPDEETVRNALERLEAALRARTAAGFGDS